MEAHWIKSYAIETNQNQSEQDTNETKKRWRETGMVFVLFFFFTLVGLSGASQRQPVIVNMVSFFCLNNS